MKPSCFQPSPAPRGPFNGAWRWLLYAAFAALLVNLALAITWLAYHLKGTTP